MVRRGKNLSYGMYRPQKNPDVVIRVDFDYSQDQDFVSNPLALDNASFSNPLSKMFQANGSVASLIDIADEKTIVKQGGWLGAWGKELTGLQPSQPGGSALLGEWVFVRKHLSWQDHPLNGTLNVGQVGNVRFVPKDVVLNVDAKGLGNLSPMVVSFSIDTFRVSMVLLKEDPYSPSSNSNVHIYKQNFTNMVLPFPANADYVSMPNYSKTSPASDYAPLHNLVKLELKVETQQGFHISFIAIESKKKLVQSQFTNPQDYLQQDQVACQEIVNSSNANNAVVCYLKHAELNGLISYNSPMQSPTQIGNALGGIWGQVIQAGLGDDVDHTIDKEEEVSTSDVQSALKFIPPKDLELPDLPKGMKWGVNLRGVILISNGKKLLWPHEVWDLVKMREDLAGLPVHDDLYELIEYGTDYGTLKAQIEKVTALMEYEKSVGNSIVLSAEVNLRDL